MGKALCDLGASINLMSLSIFKRLGLGEAKPTTVTLQLADRSLKHPRGMIEDILVKVDKLILPADFIVLDMEEDREISIILGRPFLATGGALIDVQKGDLTMRVQDQEVTFNVFKAMKLPNDGEECFHIDVVEEIVEEIQEQPTDPLLATLVDNYTSDDEEATEYAHQLEAYEKVQRYRPKFEELEQGE